MEEEIEYLCEMIEQRREDVESHKASGHFTQSRADEDELEILESILNYIVTKENQ